MIQESERMEWKEYLTSDLKREAVAFANTRGGTILVGIADDGSVTGASNPDRMVESISSMIRDGIKPDVTMFVSISIERMDEKNVVRVDIQRGTGRPYYLSDKGLKPSGVYMRLGNTSAPASETAIRDMIRETEGISYERGRSLQQDLTFQAAQTVFDGNGLSLGISQMKTLGMMDRDEIYTNLGLLLSDQCPHTIKAAVFAGEDKEVFQHRAEFAGSLFTQLSDAFAFISLNNRLQSRFSGLYRIDTNDYSETAIREALINAIVHRDYALSGSILVSMFSDRMEIVSLGGLAPGLEPEDIYEGISLTRNPGLANVMYRLKLIEAYGTGIRKIRAECERHGADADFRMTHAVFRVMMRMSMPHPDQERTVVSETGIHQEPSEQKVIDYLRRTGSANRKQVQDELGIGQTSCVVLLNRMVETGKILRSGNARNTTYHMRA